MQSLSTWPDQRSSDKGTDGGSARRQAREPRASELRQWKTSFP